ncbi:MAG: sigma-70 family RNA polymerase sigma factor [Peptococcaceae bacterium]|nr:sigma-70 family RNA polymerase sigma factor [Peptococcaceae bacterium]
MEFKPLIKKARKGDKDALLQLIMAQQADYYKLAYVYMKNEEDALDVLQDMIIILYRNISGLRKEESFYSWSKTILVNCCKKKLRHKNKTVFLDQATAESVDGVYAESEERLVLEKHLSGLSDIHQEVIRLRYFLDMEYEAIAELLKIPLGTVKSRLNKGMKQLKESFGGDIDGQY